jgi:hypothetical protein
MNKIFYMPYDNIKVSNSKEVSHKEILQGLACYLHTAIPSGVLMDFAQELGINYEQMITVIKYLAKRDTINDEYIYSVEFERQLNISGNSISTCCTAEMSGKDLRVIISTPSVIEIRSFTQISTPDEC